MAVCFSRKAGRRGSCTGTNIQQTVDTHRLFHLTGDPVGKFIEAKLTIDVQAQVAGGYFDAFAFGQISQGFDAGIPAGLLQVGVMRFGTDEVEYSSCNLDIGTEMFETLEDCCDGVSGRPGIDHEDNGKMQQAGKFGAAACHIVVSVEKSHNTLGDADVCRSAMPGIYLLYMCR